MLLVSTTGSKVRSAPHTLCFLCPSVTLHAPLSNASISAPLMSESCPSTTRNLKDFSGCFFVFRHDCACTKRSGKQKQDNAQHLRVARDPFGETGRSFALQTACTVALFLLLLVSTTGLEGAFRTAHIVCPVPYGHTARSALKCKHFRSADERVLPIHHTLPIRTGGGLVFYFLGFFYSRYQ